MLNPNKLYIRCCFTATHYTYLLPSTKGRIKFERLVTSTATDQYYQYYVAGEPTEPLKVNKMYRERSERDNKIA